MRLGWIHRMLDDPMNCPICTGKAEFELLVDIFWELPRKLNRCTVCKSCFYQNPDWLVRAYSDVISTLDTGNSEWADDIAIILTLFSLSSKYQGVNFLGFGGGTGLLARKLRDRGFDWYSTDPLASSTIPLPKVESSSSFAIVSLIEVLEHIEDPHSCLRLISAVTETIFFLNKLPLRIQSTRYGGIFSPSQGNIFSFSHLSDLKNWESYCIWTFIRTEVICMCLVVIQFLYFRSFL